jgi:hypothetical protein
VRSRENIVVDNKLYALAKVVVVVLFAKLKLTKKKPKLTYMTIYPVKAD